MGAPDRTPTELCIFTQSCACVSCSAAYAKSRVRTRPWNDAVAGGLSDDHGGFDSESSEEEQWYDAMADSCPTTTMDLIASLQKRSSGTMLWRAVCPMTMRDLIASLQKRIFFAEINALACEEPVISPLNAGNKNGFNCFVVVNNESGSNRAIRNAVNAENQSIIVAHRPGDASLLAVTETIAAARAIYREFKNFSG